MNNALVSRLYERSRGDTEGFSLPELLVVVAIIGILAAIAIPIFLNQRKKAYYRAVDSDLRNLSMEVISQRPNSGGYPAAATVVTGIYNSGWTPSASATTYGFTYVLYLNCSVNSSAVVSSDPGQFVLVGVKTSYASYRPVFDSASSRRDPSGYSEFNALNTATAGGICTSSATV